jgi:hypothetical protein
MRINLWKEFRQRLSHVNQTECGLPLPRALFEEISLFSNSRFGLIVEFARAKFA